MTDVPAAAGRRFHTSDSGEMRHNSIHDRLSNRGDNNNSDDDDGDDDDNRAHRRPQEQQTPPLASQKALLPPPCNAPMVAVQVVDRLRWWRMRRVREQPIPVHHYIFRGNYTNYSSFGTRPIAPGLTRLLQQARSVRAQYQRQQQQLQRQQRLQRAASVSASVATSGIEVAESRHQQPQQQHQQRTPPLPQRLSQESEGEALTREESDLLDNKRATGTPAGAALVAHASPPRSPTRLADGASSSGAVFTGAAAAATAVASSTGPSAATAVPPLSVAAIGSSVCSASLLSSSGPTEEEVHEAERLLRLYQPRAASVPVRSRRQRRAAGCDGVSSTAAPQQGDSVTGGSGGAAEERASPAVRLTRVPTSDDMTEVCQAAGAADCAVVLHHEPRLIIYERALNPRAALRTARVSSDALEGLRDAAAESSAGVFALTNLPLSAFERFFYQQQLSCPYRGEVHGAALTSHDGAGGSAEGVAHPGSVFPPAPLLRGEGNHTGAVNDSSADLSPAYGVVGHGEALYYGSPMTVNSPVFSSPGQSPSQSTLPATTTASRAAAAASASAAAALHAAAPRDTADRLRLLSNQDTRKGVRRRRQGASLRAVSVPCLPRVYKSGCPTLLAAAATADSTTSQPHMSAQRDGQSGHTEGTRNHHQHQPQYLLPAALRSAARPHNGAHQCHRVDDLQDVYAFNPVFDVIGKGAFSKVYAAVPILRGHAGMQRFCSLDVSGSATDAGAAAAGTTTTTNNGTSAKSGAVPLSSSATPTTSPGHPDLRPELSDAAGERGGAAAVDASTAATPPAPASTSPHVQHRRTAVRAVPVVALKVIPRKARQKAQKTAVDSPTSPPQPQQAAENADGNTSVRRELVEIEREVSILRRLHHTGCSHFYEALRSPDAFVIAMRIYPGSMDARHYLSRYGPPSEARTALALFQLVSTVHYLHTYFGLIHRDIKLENLLFSEADAAVPNSRICEVLGGSVHKADALAEEEEQEEDVLGERSPREGEAGVAPPANVASSSYEVLRLLRVTLIDFGLARRTRTVGVSASTSRIRNGGGHLGNTYNGGGGSTTRNHSLNASMTSPSHGAGYGAPATFTPSVTAAPNAAATLLNSGLPPVPPATSSSFSSAAAPAPATNTPPMVLGVRQGTSSSTGHTAMPAMPPPLFPPRCTRSPSTAVTHGPPANTTSTGFVPRVGMPSPLPSTANMFTRFLDLDEDLDEEDSVANAASTTAYSAAMRSAGDGVQGGHGGMGGCEGSITSPHTGSSFRRPGSRATFPEVGEDGVESAASSTDVSASETDTDSENDDEPSEAVAVHEAAGAPMVPLTAENFATTPAARSGGVGGMGASTVSLSQPLPSPHTPLRLSSESSAQTVAGAGGVGGAASAAPPTLSHRAPSHHYQQQLRDDTEAALLLTPCGTEKYLPPEVLSWILERGWTRRSTTVGFARAMDLYAIGIVAYVLLSGCFPFNASSRATLLQQQQRVPRCNSARWDGVSSEAITFVQRLLEPNPLKRMTAKEALEHPFLQEARQLAEKLSLVPHGEGEEEAHHGDEAGGGGLSASRPNSCSCSNSGGAGGHAGVGANSLRAHWSAAARGGGCHATSRLASPLKGGSQAGFCLPGKSVLTKVATAPEAAADAASASTAVATARPTQRCDDAAAAASLPPASAAVQDMFAAMTREVMGGSLGTAEQLSPSPPHSPAPLSSEAWAAPVTGAPQGEVPVVSPPARSPPLLLSPTTQAAKARPTPAATAAAAVPTDSVAATTMRPPTTTPPPPPTSPAPATHGISASGGGAGDDLFESLYHNIMFSD